MADKDSLLVTRTITYQYKMYKPLDVDNNGYREKFMKEVRDQEMTLENVDAELYLPNVKIISTSSEVTEV